MFDKTYAFRALLRGWNLNGQELSKSCDVTEAHMAFSANLPLDFWLLLLWLLTGKTVHVDNGIMKCL
eukprot:4413880-Amphidinium_carterae.1